MKAPCIIALAERITGKSVHLVEDPGWYKHTEATIEVSRGPAWAEDLVHEVLHWVVASDAQRISPDNLGFGHSFDGYDGRTIGQRCMADQEKVVARLQLAIYAMAGNPNGLGARDTPREARKKVAQQQMADALARAAVVGWDALMDLARAATAAGDKPPKGSSRRTEKG